MRKSKLSLLEKLQEKRAENVLSLFKRTDEELNEMIKLYMDLKKSAYEENRFEAYKLNEEKLSQIHEAKDLKFSFTDEASDWIHW